MHIFFVGTEGMLLTGIFVTMPHAKYSMAGVKYLQISKHKQKYFRALTIKESLQSCNSHSSQLESLIIYSVCLFNITIL